VYLIGERQKSAIYDVTKAKDQAKEAAANPLVQNGEQMIPSVTRVFSKSRHLYVYLQAYEPAVAAAQPGAASEAKPLIAFVTLYSGGTKVFETQPEEVKPGPNAHLGMVPLNFDIAPADLAPGKYECQVTVLDPTGQKATFWQAPIMLVP
jgi:hypothetical protein